MECWGERVLEGGKGGRRAGVRVEGSRHQKKAEGRKRG